MWTIFPWYFKVIIHQLRLHWLEHWLSTLVSVSEIFLKTKRKIYVDSTSVGGPSRFLNSIALKEFCVLREDLVVEDASHPKLLELCSDVLYQFLVAKIPQMDQLLCLFWLQEIRYRKTLLYRHLPIWTTVFFPWERNSYVFSYLITGN